LTALGLRRDDIPLALLMFNVGVEIGQFAFAALILTNNCEKGSGRGFD